MRAILHVAVIAVAAFIVNASSSIMTSFLPVYAQSMGAQLGVEIGLFTSMFLLTRIFMNYYSGKRSDRIGRKRLIVIGITICIASSLLLAVPMGWYLILCVRAIQGIGSSMVWTPSTALVGDLMPKGRRGFAMAVYNSISMVGWVLGPGLGGSVQWYFRNPAALTLEGSFQAVFYTSALLQVAALAVVLVAIREPARAEESETKMPIDRSLRRSLAAMSLLVFSFALIVALIEPLLVYHAQLGFGLTADEVTSSMTVVYLASGILVIGAQLMAGFLADRFSKKALIASAALAAQVLAFLMPAMANVADFGVLIILWYAFFSLASPVYLALLQDLFPPRLRGTLTGAFLTIFDFGSLVGPVLGFLAYDSISSSLPFAMSGILGILTVVSFLAYVKEPEVASRKTHKAGA